MPAGNIGSEREGERVMRRKIKYKVPRGFSVEICDEWAYDPKRQDPAWYVDFYGDPHLIAIVSDENDNEAHVYSNGVMRYEWGEFSLRDTSAILKETPFRTDKDLVKAINRGEISVENNAWFEVEVGDDEWEVVSTISEGIAYCVERIKERTREKVSA